jgi:amino acid permease
MSHLYEDADCAHVDAAYAEGEEGDGLGHRHLPDKLDPVYRPKAKATVISTAVNMVCNIVGGGVLAIPAALREASVIPGVCLVLLMAVISVYSMVLLTLCCEKTKRFTYKDLLTLSFNERAGRLFEVVLFCYTFGITVGYARIVADSMPAVMGDFLHAKGIFTQSWFWLIAGGAIFFPLSSLKQLSELKWSSALGIATIVYIGALVVIRFLDGTYEEPGQGPIAPDVDFFKLTVSFFEAVPLCSVIYSCHYNIPPFYGELKDRRPQVMFGAIRIALPFAVCFYLVVGLCAMFMFGNTRVGKAHGDIMNNFSSDDTAFNIGRLGMFFHFVCVFPIICIACRRALNVVVFNRAEMSQMVYVVQAFCLVLASCTVAYLVPDISTVFSLNGAAFGISIVVVLPSVFYIKLFNDATEENASSDAAVELIDQGAEDDEEGLQVADDAADKARMAVAEPSEWDLAVEKLTHVRDERLMKVSKVLVVFGAVMSVVSFTVTVISVATK